MTSNGHRALTLLRTRSHKLGIEVASWYQNVTNLKACKVCDEGMVDDECHLLFTRSAYIKQLIVYTINYHKLVMTCLMNWLIPTYL